MSEQRTSRVESNIIRPGSPKAVPTLPGKRRKAVPGYYCSDPTAEEQSNVLAWSANARVQIKLVRELIANAPEQPGTTQSAWRLYKDTRQRVTFLPMQASKQGQRVMIKYYHRRDANLQQRSDDSIRTAWYTDMIPSLIEGMDFPWLQAFVETGPGLLAPLSKRFRHQFFYGIPKVEETGVLYRKAGDLLYACDITLRGPEGIAKSIFVREMIRRADNGVEVEYRRILLDAASIFNECLDHLARINPKTLDDVRQAFAQDGMALAKTAESIAALENHIDAIQAMDGAMFERFAQTLHRCILPRMAEHGLNECKRLIEYVRKERLCSSDDPIAGRISIDGLVQAGKGMTWTMPNLYRSGKQTTRPVRLLVVNWCGKQQHGEAIANACRALPGAIIKFKDMWNKDEYLAMPPWRLVHADDCPALKRLVNQSSFPAMPGQEAAFNMVASMLTLTAGVPDDSDWVVWHVVPDDQNIDWVDALYNLAMMVESRHLSVQRIHLKTLLQMAHRPQMAVLKNFWLSAFLPLSVFETENIDGLKFSGNENKSIRFHLISAVRPKPGRLQVPGDNYYHSTGIDEIISRRFYLYPRQNKVLLSQRPPVLITGRSARALRHDDVLAKSKDGRDMVLIDPMLWPQAENITKLVMEKTYGGDAPEKVLLGTMLGVAVTNLTKTQEPSGYEMIESTTLSRIIANETPFNVALAILAPTVKSLGEKRQKHGFMFLFSDPQSVIPAIDDIRMAMPVLAMAFNESFNGSHSVRDRRFFLPRAHELVVAGDKNQGEVCLSVEGVALEIIAEFFSKTDPNEEEDDDAE